MCEIISAIFIFAIPNEPTFEFLLQQIIAVFIFATPYTIREIAKIRTQQKCPAIRYSNNVLSQILVVEIIRIQLQLPVLTRVIAWFSYKYNYFTM